MKHGPKCLEEMARNDPEGFCRLLPKQIHAEFKTTMSLPDVLGELEVLGERLGLEVKQKALPHNQVLLKQPGVRTEPAQIIDARKVAKN